MNNSIIEYQPNEEFIRKYKKVIIITLIFTMGISVYSLIQNRWVEMASMLVMSLLLVMGLFFVGFLKKEKAVFADEGIQLICGNVKKCYYVLWSDLSFIYHYRNDKNKEYLFLSPRELDREKLKELCFKSEFSFPSNGMYLENVVIIFMAPKHEKVPQIREVILSKIKGNNMDI